LTRAKGFFTCTGLLPRAARMLPLVVKYLSVRLATIFAGRSHLAARLHSAVVFIRQSLVANILLTIAKIANF